MQQYAQEHASNTSQISYNGIEPAATPKQFYEQNVVMDAERAALIEMETRSQSESVGSFAERRLRITSTMSKAIT